MRLHCRLCGSGMQRWGHTKEGKPRFFCLRCKKTTTPQRDDVELRQTIRDLKKWLNGKDNLSSVASRYRVTRQAMWKRFHQVLDLAAEEPKLPDLIKTRRLIIDGTYIHGHTLCALIAVDENDKIYWKFSPYESYAAWLDFLSSFTEPEIIVMDGQKGLFAAARTLWPNVAIQRCQFHVIAFAVQFIGRKPREQIGKDLLHILYTLKDAKAVDGRAAWMHAYRAWEQRYDAALAAKDARKQFLYPRMRSARLIIRRALPYLFTFLDHPGAPNTTNLVEGWINGAMAEALRLHRGLRIHEKKALATIILSDLIRRKTKEKSFADRLHSAKEARRARRFGRKKPQSNMVNPRPLKLF